MKSSDPTANGFYEFEFDRITIGRSKKNDLIFLDKDLPLHFLSLLFVQDQLLIKSTTRTPPYFVNGKKLSGTVKVKANDIIAFGENQIRIIKSQQTTPSLDITKAYDEFITKSPELKFALEFIEETLISLEKDENV